MEDVLTDDQSHYEISLTAGQAFVAFVLLLLSLAASFAFGLLIGRGQTDDHLAIRSVAAAAPSPAIAPVKAPQSAAREVTNDDFKAPEPTITEGTAAAVPAAVPPRAAAPTQNLTPVYAQLLSTSDQKTAEGLAAKLIEGGFTAAYVERTASDKGTIFRVRVKFPGDAEAHAAEAKLKQFSKEVWITK
jgi:hypothetical protein